MVSSRELLLLALAPGASMGFATMHLRLSPSVAPAVRSNRASTSVQMALDPQVIQGGVGFIGGIAAAVGIMYTIESQGVKSAERMDDVLKTKLNSKVDGGEAENLFSGTDQTIDALIANMEAAQGDTPKERAVKKAAGVKASQDDDDGW